METGLAERGTRSNTQLRADASQLFLLSVQYSANSPGDSSHAQLCMYVTANVPMNQDAIAPLGRLQETVDIPVPLGLSVPYPCPRTGFPSCLDDGVQIRPVISEKCLNYFCKQPRYAWPSWTNRLTYTRWKFSTSKDLPKLIGCWDVGGTDHAGNREIINDRTGMDSYIINLYKKVHSIANGV